MASNRGHARTRTRTVVDHFEELVEDRLAYRIATYAAANLEVEVAERYLCSVAGPRPHTNRRARVEVLHSSGNTEVQYWWYDPGRRAWRSGYVPRARKYRLLPHKGHVRQGQLGGP